MIDLYLTIQQTFQLTPLQLEKLKDVRRYRPDLLEKAFKSTQKYKPGDLAYFKGSYRHYALQAEKSFQEKAHAITELFTPQPFDPKKYQDQWQHKPWAKKPVIKTKQPFNNSVKPN